MSWSFNTRVTAGEVKSKLLVTAQAAKARMGADPEGSGWADDQVAEAIEVAARLVGGGSVGHSGKLFLVSCNGHANPSHEPRAGWVDDTVTVTVTQVVAG